MIQFKNAHTDGMTDEVWMEGQNDGQMLFYRTLLATTGGPIIPYLRYPKSKQYENLII